MNQLQGFTVVSGRQVAEAADDIPDAEGLYFVFVRRDSGLLDRSGYAELDGRPTLSCEGLDLLYVGSTRALRTRLRQHVVGDTRGSNLRLTIAAILIEELALVPIVGRRRSCHFGIGEQVLTRWIETQAVFAFTTCDDPLDVERGLVRQLPLPLNIEFKGNHPHATALRARRRDVTGGPKLRRRPGLIVRRRAV
jgi:hypothetical protein